jgi:chromosome segregation ATPase
LGFGERVMAKVLGRVDKRTDWRIERKLEERVMPELPRQTEAFAALAEDVASALHTLSELRRWTIDDLEAANETTMLLGESLTRLQSSVDRLEREVSTIADRLARIEAAVAGPEPAGSGVGGHDAERA